jgi:hypothetical protein
MSALTLPTSCKQWHRDQKDNCSDVDPDRKNEVEDDAEADESEEPDGSITQGEAALHISSIGVPRQAA